MCLSYLSNVTASVWVIITDSGTFVLGELRIVKYLNQYFKLLFNGPFGVDFSFQTCTHMRMHTHTHTQEKNCYCIIMFYKKRHDEVLIEIAIQPHKTLCIGNILSRVK